MSSKSLLALTLVGAVVLFLIGWAAPSPALSGALAVPPVPPAQPDERETAVAALPHGLVDPGQAPTRAGRRGALPGPSCQVEAPARPDKCVAPCPSVAAWPTPPAPPA